MLRSEYILLGWMLNPTSWSQYVVPTCANSMVTLCVKMQDSWRSWRVLPAKMLNFWSPMQESMPRNLSVSREMSKGHLKRCMRRLRMSSRSFLPNVCRSRSVIDLNNSIVQHDPRSLRWFKIPRSSCSNRENDLLSCSLHHCVSNWIFPDHLRLVVLPTTSHLTRLKSIEFLLSPALLLVQPPSILASRSLSNGRLLVIIRARIG